jgi:hypothetical protein
MGTDRQADQGTAFEPGSAPAPASLSVVVPTFARPVSLERCLRALAAQTRPPEQIVVVCRADDPASHELTLSLSREIPIEAVMCDVPLCSAQLDLGAAAAIGDVVALTDDDAMPRSEWAERLLGLYSAPDVGAAGGRDVLPDALATPVPRDARVGLVTLSGRALGNHDRPNVGVRDVDYLKGVNLSLRRQLWHVDHDLLGRGTQSSWEIGTCLRIRRLGWRVVYDPGLLVDHEPAPRVGVPARSSRDPQMIEYAAHNELYELLRWLPWWQSAIAASRAVLVGSKAEPGPMAGIWMAAHGKKPRQALAEVRVATAGRWRALLARPRRDRWAS